MPKLSIDGKTIEVEEGTTVFEAARQSGIAIPHFCYHPKLSIAGNCRMCLVQIEKQPKPAISCNTVAMEGMVIHTRTPEVQALQKSVLEFILINHPIDCPVCDQAGECKLQEYYMDYTLTESEFGEAKVKKPKRVDLGPHVVLDDERCILCSRCIRFCDEISKTGELCFTERGDRSTLTTFPGRQLDNKYSLNTVDICPVGALTSKPFRFKKRVWLLKNVPSICTGCATGCNIHIDYDDGRVWRYRTRENESVNQCWTCDEGRLSYPMIHEHRLVRPMLRQNGNLEPASVSDALGEIIQDLKKMGGEGTLVLASAQESNENNQALKKLAEAMGVQERLYTAREVEQPHHDDFLIKADKNPNRAGVEYLGFKKFGGGTQVKVVLALGDLPASAVATIKQEEPALVVLLAAHEGPGLEVADVVLPSATHAEQAGSFTNFQNRVQKFAKALEPIGQVRAAWQWLEALAHGLELNWGPLSPEQLLREGFGLSYDQLEKEGKVLE